MDPEYLSVIYLVQRDVFLFSWFLKELQKTRITIYLISIWIHNLSWLFLAYMQINYVMIQVFAFYLGINIVLSGLSGTEVLLNMVLVRA